jgi:hypothetical protein
VTDEHKVASSTTASPESGEQYEPLDDDSWDEEDSCYEGLFGGAPAYPRSTTASPSKSAKLDEDAETQAQRDALAEEARWDAEFQARWDAKQARRWTNEVRAQRDAETRDRPDPEIQARKDAIQARAEAESRAYWYTLAEADRRDAEIEARRDAEYLGAPSPDAEAWVAAFVLGNFSAAFVQALGQRAANGTAKLPERISDLVRTRVRRKGKPGEYHIGVGDGSAATIALTEDTPDVARFALLDLDLTADEVRGKLLRWDSNEWVWRPADD